MSYREQFARYYAAASRLDVSYLDAEALRRDSQRLHTLAEKECNGYIERDEEDGKMYANYNIDGPGPIKRHRIKDYETPALARIRAIAEKYGAKAEFQGDPRGWPIELTWPDRSSLSPPCR